MKALLRKDFYVLASGFKTVLLIWMVFPIVALISPQNISFILYIGLIAGTLSSTLISYEEREKWPIYAGTLPLSKKQIVTERYLFTLIMVLIASLIGVLVMLTYIIRGYGIYTSVAVLVQNFATSLVMPSLLLPITYRYGVEKGRYVVMFLVIIFALGSQKMSELFTGSSGYEVTVIPLMLLGSFALFAASYYLSLRLYKKMETH